jgi:hypothetical protein
VSLRKAGRRLGLNAHYVKGMAETLGIHLEDAPPSLLMSEADFARIKQQHEKIQRERQPADAVAS